MSTAFGGIRSTGNTVLLKMALFARTDETPEEIASPVMRKGTNPANIRRMYCVLVRPGTSIRKMME
jgi:hypothetical protein